MFRQAIARADLVVATGGLGPTADDLTRQSLAQATARELQLDQKALEHVRGMFARRGRPMPPQNEIQAMFPAGSRVIANPHGTAPGIDLVAPRPAASVPRLLSARRASRNDRDVARVGRPGDPRPLGADRRVIRRRLIHCFGAGESQIESMLPDLIRRGRQPLVGITASKATITLRITAEGRTEEECSAAMEPTVATIRQCLGTLVFGEDDDQLQHAVVRLLGRCGQTLATVECGAAGLLAEWLGGVEGSADVYLGGLLLTNPTTKSTETMAACCRAKFGADYGLAVGFLPSPTEREAEREGGQPLVALVLASPEGIRSQSVPLLIHPDLLRIYIAKQALNLVRLTILA